jgi:hypothetical protein
MNPRTKNLALAVGAFLALVYVGWAFFGKGGAASVVTSDSPAPMYSSPSPSVGSGYAYDASPSPNPLLSPAPVSASDGQVAPATVARSSYALLESDVTGLPPDAQPGTQMQLWVSWAPPVTKARRLQLLLRDVVLEKIIPGITPEAPATILLSLRAKDVPDMLWADRYGELSIVVTG